MLAPIGMPSWMGVPRPVPHPQFGNDLGNAVDAIFSEYSYAWAFLKHFRLPEGGATLDNGGVVPALLVLKSMWTLERKTNNRVPHDMLFTYYTSECYWDAMEKAIRELIADGFLATSTEGGVTYYRNTEAGSALLKQYQLYMQNLRKPRQT